MHTIQELQSLIHQDLEEFYSHQKGDPMYEPMYYLLDIGGKRMRPCLTFLGYQLFDDRIETVRKTALAIEVFHNFTLMHDDIMDNAPLRRGKATVHEKFNINTGILSGDAMLIESYNLLISNSCNKLQQVIEIFNETAIGVCKGHQLDMSFENRSDVTLEEYIEMIRLKTAVLLGGALKIGALKGGASQTDQEHLYQSGQSLGIAFQLLDDYLDAFGNPESFGKKVGGDIIADKKTFLFITLLQKINDSDRETLMGPFENDNDKVTCVKELMVKYNVDQEILKLAKQYSASAIEHLNAVQCDESKKYELHSLINQLLLRQV